MWNNLEHKFLQQIKSYSSNSQFLLAISGGRDSMVLLNLFINVIRQNKLAVAHVHHGPGAHLNFRNQARDGVAELCQAHQLPFFSVESTEILTSENEMREFRYSFLYETQKKMQEAHVGPVFLVTAHHSQDQIETQLLQLIRGAGVEGARAMHVQDGVLLRPLLNFKAEELQEYAEEKKILFFQDPSNQETDYFRNWLRHEWLASLEAKKPGSVFRLQESLSTVLSLIPERPVQVSLERGIDRSEYEFSSLHQQRTLLYYYIQAVQSHVKLDSSMSQDRVLLLSISRGQIEEIQKRLDKSQKELTFEAMGLFWQANARQIKASKLN